MNIINAMLDSITQTDEWNRMQESPIITQAAQSLQETIKNLPAQQREEIEAAAAIYATACERAALLFGIGLVDTIRAAGTDPTAYLQEWGE